ncbi:D-alanyl-D-alanine carboxypeptidase family protein [Streptomyces polyrhachis]|uniref:D-alanyl-D-alanine carboxypeptidase family protein n=1 Tax=Streptomyces polyrhachis TaxID=1282885 RepID=A0ABW2GC69_9ACTN
MARATVTACLLLGPLAGVAAAQDGGKTPMPPDTMSNVGGDRLAQPGTQADIAVGAPQLPKKLTARSWVVADAESGQVLAAHNAHWKLAPASTLKMLFADTLLPRFPATEQHKVLPAELQGIGAGSSAVGIKENETYTVKDLWLGVFLRSGNDAVHVLTAMNGGKDATVAAMNAKAAELGAADTHVVEPDGYDAKGQTSSAYDLTLFGRAGMQNPDFRTYAATATAQFPGGRGKGGKRESFEIQNTNRLLTGDYDVDVYKGIAGIKNGNTTEAGATFTGVAERDGRVLLVTVMHPAESAGHNAVYREAAKLLDWGFTAGDQVTPVGQLVPPKSALSDTEDAKAGAQSPSSAPETREKRAHAQAAAREEQGGAGTALLITAGSLLLVALVVLGVRRLRPLPGGGARTGGGLGVLRAALRRGRRGRRPGGAAQQEAGHEADPQQQGDGDAEGAVDALGGDAGQVPAEQKL